MVDILEKSNLWHEYKFQNIKNTRGVKEKNSATLKKNFIYWTKGLSISQNLKKKKNSRGGGGGESIVKQVIQCEMLIKSQPIA